MRTPTSSPRAPWHGPRASARTRRLTAAVAIAVLLAACSRGGDEAAPTDGPPPGEAVQVAGRAGLVFHDVSTSGTLVFPVGSSGDTAIPADRVAITATADAITAWLDAVLSERNVGQTTTLANTDVDVTAVATALGIGGPATDGVLDEQVVGATYLIEIAHLGAPGWALARVESRLAPLTSPATETGRRLDTFVFSVAADGTIEFLALEVAP
jgi:hypothetical protein